MDARIDGIEPAAPSGDSFRLFWNEDRNLNVYALYSAGFGTFEEALAKLRELKGNATVKAYLLVSQDKSHIIPYQQPECAAAAWLLKDCYALAIRESRLAAGEMNKRVMAGHENNTELKLH